MTMYRSQVIDSQLLALPTVSTASGSIATFDTDMTENLIEIVCDIQYQQASGTPTPQDEKPIKTYTEMNVLHSGKNLFDLNKIIPFNVNVTVTKEGNKITVANTNNYPINFYYGSHKKMKQGVYTVSIKSAISAAINVYKYLNGSISYFSTGITAGNTSGQFTILEEGEYILTLNVASNTSISVENTQIEIGSRATEYEPYNGNTYNIPFGQTVAKGTLNVTTGVLEITHFAFKGNGLILVKSSTSGNLSTFNITLSSNNFPSAKARSAKSSHFSLSIASGSGRMAQNATNIFVIIDNTLLSEDTAVGFVNWLIANDVTFYYECATPQVIQLSATQITALLNENNIWCDTGDTEVKYLLTVGKAIS